MGGRILPIATSQDSAGIHFPPPFLYALGFGAGLLLNREWPWTLGTHAPLLGWLLIAMGVAFAGTAIVTFARVGTAIIPNRPATQVVGVGPYRLSRNPMYVGLTSVYLGLVALTGVLWPLLFLPLVLWVLVAAVINREERYLAQKFGAQYEAYRLRVRRWL